MPRLPPRRPERRGDAVNNTIAETTPTCNSTYAGANRHVGCLDCHNPHESGATLHTKGTNAIAATGSPLSGVGFTASAGNWATPTATWIASNVTS